MTMKKLLSLLLVLCLLAVPMNAFAAVTDTDAAVSATDAVPAGEGTDAPEALVLASVSDVADFILDPIVWCEIQIVPAVLTAAEGARDVYFVALRGAGLQMNKANNAFACLLSAFNRESNYYRMARDAIFQYVPEGSAVVFAGHSLGGMIEQQLSCAAEFTAKYELLNTLNMGSPAVMTKNENREGPLVRCVDKQDVIPKLSPCVFTDRQHYNDCIRLDGGYLGNPDGAHNLSYPRADLWGAYDVLGVKDGGATLTLNPAEITILKA